MDRADHIARVILTRMREPTVCYAVVLSDGGLPFVARSERTNKVLRAGTLLGYYTAEISADVLAQDVREQLERTPE